MKRRTLLLATVSILVAIAASFSPASAAEEQSQSIEVDKGVEGVDYINPAKPHCVTSLFSPEQISAGVDTTMTEATCFATLKEAEAHANRVETTSRSSFQYQAIAQHCDGLCGNSGTATLTISGTNCDGGGLIFTSPWRDEIYENRHKKCGLIKMWSNNYAGATASTSGNYNAYRTLPSVMQYDAGSARYYGPVN